MPRDYYEILGISKDASLDEIKTAYRKFARKYHPDMNPNNKAEAEEKFKEISEAYDVLMDTQKRAAYDRYGHAGVSQQYGPGGFDMGDFMRAHQTDLGDLFSEVFSGGLGDLFGGSIFGDLFGTGTTQRRGRYTTRGGDIKVRIPLTLKEIYTGAEKKIRIKRKENCKDCGGKGGKGFKTCPVCGGQGRVRQTQQSVFGQFSSVSVCPNCRGRGEVAEEICTSCNSTGVVGKIATITVKIPAGVQNGNYLSLREQGNAGEHNGPPGDLIVVVEEKPDHVFTRNGNNIHIRVPIVYPLAVLGGKIKVKTLSGDVMLRIPAGTQSDQVFRLRGKGMPNLQGYGSGAQLVEVYVDVPRHPSREVRELIKKLSKIKT